tara:strand:- start:130 stop:312 length:183 start_codon:yes stop_codon:yes gene_type:complete
MKKNQQLAQLLMEIHEQWARDNGYRDKGQAPSSKPQAGLKLQAPKATSSKHQAPSSKRQA